MKQDTALTIAGSDSSGGAGIQADLKAFSFLGIHGANVITCITAQNTKRVNSIFPIPLKEIERQIDTVFEDLQISSVKTGMLYDKNIVELVAKKMQKYAIHPVVDPVMVATSGDVLSKKNLNESFIKHLFPQAIVITANIMEAEALTGCTISTEKHVKQVCEHIYGFGSKNVLIKGGHLEGKNSVDFLYDGKDFYRFELPRIAGKKAHGSGCTLAALITGLLVQNMEIVDVVKQAKYMVWAMINEGFLQGNGADILNHHPSFIPPVSLQNLQEFEVWNELTIAAQQLIKKIPTSFIPEVGMNFCYALPHATALDEICGLDGRIMQQEKSAKQCGTFCFGKSKHVASIVLAAKSKDSRIRSALNIKYSQKNLNVCKKAGLIIGCFERKNEPKTTSSTMEWGTLQAFETLKQTPDVIYDKGGVGKEPMIRFLGENPKEIIIKLEKIL